MINGKRVAVVMPAYNAEKTLEQTIREVPESVDIKILVDDASSDRAFRLAQSLGLKAFAHDGNYGFCTGMEYRNTKWKSHPGGGHARKTTGT